jgi:glycosyltransferase involved in cell wall biosynthesis
MCDKLVSIIIPLYNSEKYIGNTILSVMNQTYKNWELFVVDDCSTDNSRAIVKNFTELDSRIHLVESEINFGGPARPRNIGIHNSNGEYIAFLDSDDLWFSEKLEVCIKSFHSGVDIVFHDFVKYGNVNFFTKKIMKGRKLPTPVTKSLLLQDNVIINSSVIVRKKIIKDVGCIDESKDMIAAEDYNLWLKISIITNNFLYIPRVLGEYLVGDGNISSKDMSVCSKRASENFERYLTVDELLQYDAILNYMKGRYFYINKEYFAAQEYLYKSLNFGSIGLRAKSLYMLCTSSVYKIALGSK